MHCFQIENYLQTETNGARLNAVIRAIYSCIGLIMLYETIFLALSLPEKLDISVVFVLITQATLFFTGEILSLFVTLI